MTRVPQKNTVKPTTAVIQRFIDSGHTSTQPRNNIISKINTYFNIINCV